MQKFAELQYERPDFDQLEIMVKEYIEGLKNAKSYEELRNLYLEHAQKEGEVGTMITIASIRNTVNTKDEFYDGEMTYIHQRMPKIGIIEKEADKVILESPFLEDFRAEFGDLLVKKMEYGLKLSSEAIVPNMIEESKLTQEYSKASASCTTMFRGEECNFSKLLKYMQSTDRETRKEAFEAWADLYAKIAPELDAIYDKLIAQRIDMAKKLGFEDYTTMQYLRRGRYDYKPEDVANFRKQVKEVIVPVCQKLYEAQKERLGVDHLYFYDEKLLFPNGNATPIGDREYLVNQAHEMYKDLSPETAEFFDFMTKYEMFDLENKPGKRMGGYCTFLPSYKAPFIFSNFNGTSADVDVLTHEAGHAFESYTACKTQPLRSMIFSTSEINEIHSMAMEHFAYPYMEKFFGDKTKEYLYAHLADALEVIPYMVCVDEFQHRVYEKPDMTAKERYQVWHEIEKNYMPWRDYGGHEFMEAGGFWMQKQHIFLYPFYYIDYALAQICAFELYGKMKKDTKAAWADYYRLCQAGGSKGYFELLKLANLSNPFESGTVEKVIANIAEELLGEN